MSNFNIKKSPIQKVYENKNVKILNRNDVNAIKHVEIKNDALDDNKIEVYPFKKGSFYEIRGTFSRGGGRLIIDCQKDIDDLRKLVDQLDYINKSVNLSGKKTKPKKEPNRFAELEILMDGD